MGNDAELRWSRAFDALFGGERAMFALFNGFPVRGRGLTLLPEVPLLDGEAVELGGTWSRPVVMALRVERGERLLQRPLRLRLGRWPVPHGGALWVAGRKLAVPEHPEHLLEGLDEALIVGSLSELLRLNLRGHPLESPPDATLLGAGAEGLLDGLTARLSGRLETGWA